jgi:hypothetical protein
MLAVTRHWVVQTMDEIVDETTLLVQLEQKNDNAEKVLRAQLLLVDIHHSNALRYYQGPK